MIHDQYVPAGSTNAPYFPYETIRIRRYRKDIGQSHAIKRSIREVHRLRIHRMQIDALGILRGHSLPSRSEHFLRDIDTGDPGCGGVLGERKSRTNTHFQNVLRSERLHKAGHRNAAGP
ncbi:hypothetical protein GmRootV15_00940 [Variovorax sp. V15]